MKITVIGAAGGIGQPLSLLLKTTLPTYQTDFELTLYDLAPITLGVATDLSHIPTNVRVTGYCGEDPIPALQNANLVIICAGVARKPGMTRTDLFAINAGIAKSIAQKISKACPSTFVGVITNPVNSIVPIMADSLKQLGVYDAHKMFGVTTLDVIRAQTFLSEITDTNLPNIKVIGGHSGKTILPLLSQIENIQLTLEQINTLTKRIQNAGTQVIEAKAGSGSATLSMAQAGCHFVRTLVRAFLGESGVTLCAFVEGGSPYARFFAQEVLLDTNGIKEILDLETLSDFEQNALREMLNELRADIQRGEDFVKNQ